MLKIMNFNFINSLPSNVQNQNVLKPKRRLLNQNVPIFGQNIPKQKRIQFISISNIRNISQLMHNFIHEIIS